MSNALKTIWGVVLACLLLSCSGGVATRQDTASVTPTVPIATQPPAVNTNSSQPASQQTPEEELATNFPKGKIDFKNYKYPLPRGWQGGEGEVALVNGRAQMTEDQIGASYVKTLYGDVTGDGKDEAFAIIKIETGGSALPQVVYVFNAQGELMWYFRTGDRADGGLKNVRAENGQLVVELFGQDRFLFGDVETMKITGDEEQLCCPTFFTRTVYKWNGRNFLLQGKRLTYSVKDPAAAPVENMGDKIHQEQKAGKK